MQKEMIYADKDEKYFSWTRNDIIDLVSEGNNKILEIGCGIGNTGLVLKKLGKAKEIFGVELLKTIGDKAKEKIDTVIIGDIEEIDLPFPENYFDYIIFGDILEHLVNPWETLKKIKKYLSKSGILIASIPNTRHWRILRDLLFYGRWEYGERIEKTHLRFFTRKGIFELFSNTGFEIKMISYNMGNKSRILNAFTFGMFKDFLINQFIIRARK